MKTHNNLYKELCSKENLLKAYLKARKGKLKKKGVIEFSKNLEDEVNLLQKELLEYEYKPQELRKFIVRDPKTRKIHASAFRDRVIHHAIINILEPIYEKIFIYDSFASRKNKGSHKAVKRFDYFKRKVSCNGKLLRKNYNSNSIEGYILKADIKHYFETVDHDILIKILNKKINDKSFIWLIKQVLNNFESKENGRGMPLGNFTSQFFANIYLNELDYFVKHDLKAKYYIRYVDDFVILHKSKNKLEYYYKPKITNYLKTLNLEIHPDKSQITPFHKGIQFLGYRIFYHHKLLRKRNLRKFSKKFSIHLKAYRKGIISKTDLLGRLQGWFGYSQWANTYKLRNKILNEINFNLILVW